MPTRHNASARAPFTAHALWMSAVTLVALLALPTAGCKSQMETASALRADTPSCDSAALRKKIEKLSAQINARQKSEAGSATPTSTEISTGMEPPIATEVAAGGPSSGDANAAVDDALALDDRSEDDDELMRLRQELAVCEAKPASGCPETAQALIESLAQCQKTKSDPIACVEDVKKSCPQAYAAWCKDDSPSAQDGRCRVGLVVPCKSGEICEATVMPGKADKPDGSQSRIEVGVKTDPRNPNYKSLSDLLEEGKINRDSADGKPNPYDEASCLMCHEQGDALKKNPTGGIPPIDVDRVGFSGDPKTDFRYGSGHKNSACAFMRQEYREACTAAKAATEYCTDLARLVKSYCSDADAK